MASKTWPKVILIIARLLGTLELVFLLVFLIADLIGQEMISSEGFSDTLEMISFLMFPSATIIGLLVAYKWPGWGGLISTLGFIGLSIIRTDLIAEPTIMIMAIPGILYLIYWIVKR